MINSPSFNLPKRSFVAQTKGRLDELLLNEIASSTGALPISRSQLKQWITGGHVTVQGKVILKAGYPLSAGDRVEYLPPVTPAPTALEPYSLALDVLYEDRDLIVINKPAGLTMHPGAGNRSTTLANALIAHCTQLGSAFPSSFRPGIVHRLDKDTSGVVVVAKSTNIHAALAEQWKERSIERTYCALAFLSPRRASPFRSSDSGTIRQSIGRDPHHRLRMAIETPQSRTATTHWKVIDRFHFGTLLELRLETGRTHQIRVHLAANGSPIIGDSLYWGEQQLPITLRNKAVEFGRQALHAQSLSFTHPVSKERLEFRASLPEDMLTLIEAFRLSSIPQTAG